MFEAEGIASARALRQGHAWRVRGTSKGSEWPDRREQEG